MERRHIVRLVIVVALTAVVVAVLLRGRLDENDAFDPRDFDGRIVALIGRGDADSFMAAAMLAESNEMLGGNPPHAAQSRAVRYARDASRLAPEDPVIQWAWLSICRAHRDCEREAASEAFKRVAPENAAAWLLDLGDALQVGDQAAADLALERISGSKELRHYWNPTIVRVTDALDADGARPRDRLRYWSLREHFVIAIGGAIVGVPSFTEVKRACEADIAAARRVPCHALLRLMRDGDTLLAQALGAGLAWRWSQPGSPEWITADARRRELDWLRDRSAESEMKFWNAQLQWDTPERLSLMRRFDSETEVMRQLLRARGIPIEPPEGWTPG